MRTIYCKSETKQSVSFKVNGRNYVIPTNKPISVPDDVYLYWTNTEYNPDRR